MYKFLFILFFPTILLANDYIDNYIENLEQKRGTLFITDPVQIKDLETVIYIINNTSFQKKLTTYFKKFSSEIGEKNGGIILDPEDIYYPQYLEYSYCDPEIFEGSKIIFEDKVNLSCYTYKIDNNQQYYNVLVKIKKIIDKESNFFQEYTKHKLRKIVEQSDNNISKIFIDDITNLFDLIIRKLMPKDKNPNK